MNYFAYRESPYALPAIFKPRSPLFRFKNYSHLLVFALAALSHMRISSPLPFFPLQIIPLYDFAYAQAIRRRTSTYAHPCACPAPSIAKNVIDSFLAFRQFSHKSQFSDILNESFELTPAARTQCVLHISPFAHMKNFSVCRRSLPQNPSFFDSAKKRHFLTV